MLTWVARSLACVAGEWHVLNESSGGAAASSVGLLGVLEGHRGPVYALALSEQGWLATGATDRSVAVWNTTVRRADGSLVARWEPFRRFQGHRAGVTALAFARLGVDDSSRPSELPQPDASCVQEVLISGGADNATRIWDVRESRQLAMQPHPRTVFGVAVQRSSDEFATACWDGTVRIFTLPSGAQKADLPGHEGGLYSVAYSPLDGSLLASASADRTVRIWDVKKMQLLWTLRSHKDHVTTIDWSPVKKYALASGGWDRRFRLWEIPDREADSCRSSSQCSARLAPSWMGKHPQLVWRVAFAPGGDRVAACHGAVGQSPTVVIYDAASGRVVRRLGRHKDTPLAIAWSPDGALLASAGMDRKVLVYDALGAHDDMPQGDLDDTEEKAQWLEDLARYRQEKQLGSGDAASAAAEQRNGTENGTDPKPWTPHPLAGRAAFF